MMMHNYEENLEELSNLCKGELFVKRLNKKISISEHDLKDEIVYRYLYELMNSDEDAIRGEVVRLVDRIYNFKVYGDFENKETT